MQLDYDHTNVVSPLKLVQDRRDAFGFQPAFGSSNIRFPLAELTSNPGVGEYNTHVSSVLKKSPSFSTKGYGNAFVSKKEREKLWVEKDVPGPAHYNIASFGHLSPDKQRPSTGFIPSGNGRVPFAPPNDVPGPLDYVVNHDHGKSPLQASKRSASFESLTKRDSFFDKQSPAPGPAKYRTERANKYVYGTGGNADIDWKRSSIPDRFDHIGKDNNVPGVHTYFEKPFVHPSIVVNSPTRPSTGFSGFFNDFVEPPPSPASRKTLVRTGTATSYVLDEHHLERSSHHYNNDKKPSLRTVGNYRGKMMGKMNQTPMVSHTFGADKDRFKNSVFGRLDLAGQIPGPGAYDYPLSMGKVANKMKDKVQSAADLSRPSTASFPAQRPDPASNAAHLSFRPLKSPPQSPSGRRPPGPQFPDV